MGNNILGANEVALVGVVVSRFRFNHEFYGEKFYVFDLAIARTSDYVDYIPIMISEKLVDVNENLKGTFVYVSGSYRSFNLQGEERNKLILTVFANEIEIDVDYEQTNNIFLNGYVCKPPVNRKTPLGREITELLVAVNRAYGKSDYIPCVVWGRNAKYASKFDVGERVKIWGRVQSREYTKKISETESENRIAYEVSVKNVEVDYE